MTTTKRRTIGAGVVNNVPTLDQVEQNVTTDTEVLDSPEQNEMPDLPSRKENGVAITSDENQPIVSAASILGLGGAKSVVEESADKAPVLILRKIPKGNFRLGLEKQEDNPQLMPGAVHKFEPFMQGNSYLTALANKPADRERLEAILMVDLKPESPFYATVTYIMNDRPHGQFMVLDNSANGAYEEVVFNCMIASPLVANGIHEYRSGKKPMAEWYIENKEAEAIVESNKVDVELKMFETLALMPDSRRVEIAKIMRLPDAHTGSPTLIKTELYKVLKSGNKLMTAQSAVEKFLMISAWDPQRIVVATLVEDAENFNIIRLTKTKDWSYADQILGASKDEVVQFLMAPKSSQIRESISSKVLLMSK